ncbi:MAG: Na+/H+ antiporter NhaC family protein [Pseudomonadales bacterium]|jgi:Na+/H+ antiporter NhaC|nr:Na+/H+ antiporter NhaC family protein [Pseudomonadales bacterium]
MPDPGPLSLLPVLVTLGLALASRNVILGLFAGVCTGVLQLGESAPWRLLPVVIGEHLVPQVTDGYNAGVLVLLVFIGGFVALVERSGGAGAIARAFAHRLHSRTRVQFGAWAGGIAIFFSDLGTPLIVGPVFRPLADRLKLSRQKLALILDATASPVAILIPFIGWGVYVMGLLRKTFDGQGLDGSEYAAFVAAIPFQFYAWLAIATVPLLAVGARDWGPMAAAERARARGETSGFDAAAAPPDASDHDRARASLVWMPLLAMAVTLLVLLGPSGFPLRPVPGAEFRAGLASAYLVAALVLVALSALQGVRRPLENLAIYLAGMSGMMGVAVTLVLAWTLSDLGDALGAPAYVSGLLTGALPPGVLPLLVFLVGAAVSFATGSSWGTFAILIPLAVPAALALDAPLAVTVAAVLSGGLFGDHASPISETTILSSTGAGTPQF